MALLSKRPHLDLPGPSLGHFAVFWVQLDPDEVPALLDADLAYGAGAGENVQNC